MRYLALLGVATFMVVGLHASGHPYPEVDRLAADLAAGRSPRREVVNALISLADHALVGQAPDTEETRYALQVVAESVKRLPVDENASALRLLRDVIHENARSVLREGLTCRDSKVRRAAAHALLDQAKKYTTSPSLPSDLVGEAVFVAAQTDDPFVSRDARCVLALALYTMRASDDSKTQLRDRLDAVVADVEVQDCY